MSQLQLLKFVVAKFPRRDYLNDATVRHNRKGLLKSIEYLRTESSTGWVIDNPVERDLTNYILLRK